MPLRKEKDMMHIMLSRQDYYMYYASRIVKIYLNYKLCFQGGRKVSYKIYAFRVEKMI